MISPGSRKRAASASRPVMWGKGWFVIGDPFRRRLSD
jgi:hypothetical protein